MHRFKLLLSPILEQKIKDSIINKDTALCSKISKFLLTKINEIDENYRDEIIFVFPLELKNLIEKNDSNSCTVYKTLIELFTEEHYEIVRFMKKGKIPTDNCSSKISINNIAFNGNTNYSKNLFLHFLNEGNISFFIDIDTEDIVVKKSKCPNKKCLSEEDILNGDTNIKCTTKIDLKFRKSSDDIINFLIEQNYQDNIFKLKEINELTINDILFLIYKSLGKDLKHEYYNKNIINLKYHDKFFDDIKNCSIQETKDLLTALFCGTIKELYQNKVFGIERHSENTSLKIGEFKLSRIYVKLFDYKTKRFKGKSGARRILVADLNDITFVLAYTKYHDFDQEDIEKRLKDIRNSIQY